MFVFKGFDSQTVYGWFEKIELEILPKKETC